MQKRLEKQKINKSLKYIIENLELSVDLRLKTSRDSSATPYNEPGSLKDEIGEMMGHSTPEWKIL